jgi:hypothetical protein
MRTDFRSWMAALALAALFLLAMASACNGKKPPAAGIQTVQAGVVEEIEPDAAERYSATILPNLQVDLAFKSPGLIEEFIRCAARMDVFGTWKRATKSPRERDWQP